MLSSLVFLFLGQTEIKVLFPGIAVLCEITPHVSDCELWQFLLLSLQVSQVVLGIRRILSDKLIEIERNVGQKNDKENSGTDETLLG